MSSGEEDKYSVLRQRERDGAGVVWRLITFQRLSERAGGLITGNKLKDIQAWSRDAKGETDGPAQRLSQHQTVLQRQQIYEQYTCNISHCSLFSELKG